MMLAARDQENLFYSHQLNAAGKPLNHAHRGLQSKTAGERAPKTPFKKPSSDENNLTGFGAQKTGLGTIAKGDENYVQGKKQNGIIDNKGFVTPMGPRTRAPLGMKTTNAKTRAFQTPAPIQQITKPERTLKKASSTARSAKSKLRIAISEPAEAEVLSNDPDLEVPEIEYCPPNPVALPDPPVDITYDDNLPYLRGDNICSGYADVYDIPRDEHGVSLKERRAEEAHARILREMDDEFRKEMARALPMEAEDKDEGLEAMIAEAPHKYLVQSSNIDTAKAKEAASALSAQPLRKLPAAAMKETASSKQKKKPNLLTLGTKKPAVQPMNPSSMRHNAAVAASKTTIGYSKGRNVSSRLPEETARAAKPKSAQHDPSKTDSMEIKAPVGKNRGDQCNEYGLFDREVAKDGNDLEGQLWGMEVFSDSDEEIFQLPMPDET